MAKTREIVEILKIGTGEVRIYTSEEMDEEYASAYIWEDGNYACDCNRAIFFDRAKDEDGDLEGYECGEGRFAVLSVKTSDGRLIYQEGHDGKALTDLLDDAISEQLR